jgi:hypothetical protein
METQLSKIRVAALARDLGIPSRKLLEILNGMGEYTKSASSTVEAPTVRKVRAHLDRSAPGTPPPPATPPERPQNNPWKPPAIRARDVAKPPRYTGARPRPRSRFQRAPEAPTPYRPSTVAPPLVGQVKRPNPDVPGNDARSEAAAIFDVPAKFIRLAKTPRPRYGEEHRTLLSPEDSEWVKWHMDLTAKDVWMAHGLGSRDAKLAFDCAQAGLMPSDLGRHIDGFTIGYRLSHGEPLDWILKRMREAK